MTFMQIRQTDDTGRIVIPKEMRESLRLEGKPLAIHLLEDKSGIAVLASKSVNTRSRRKLDEEGRLLINSAIRKQLGWGKVKQLEITASGESLLLKEPAKRCAICGSAETLMKIKEEYLCEDCLHLGNQNVAGKWEELLDGLMKHYIKKCRQALEKKDDKEAVHHARTTGRKLRNLLEFIGLRKNHPIIERIKEAHKHLGKARDQDVLREAFEKRAAGEEDDKLRAVYLELADLALGKPRKKLEKKLPDVINDDFQHLWDEFLHTQMGSFVLMLNVDEKLKEHEEEYQKLVSRYKQAAEQHGSVSKKGMEALHKVRIKAKGMRYLYKYADEIEGGGYKEQTEHYKAFQDSFGEINDRKTWLEELDKNEKKIKASKKEIKKVKHQLTDELAELVSKIDFGAEKGVAI